MTSIPLWVWILTILITAISFLLVAAAIFVRTIHSIFNPKSPEIQKSKEPIRKQGEDLQQILATAENRALERIRKMNARQAQMGWRTSERKIVQPKQITKKL